MHQLCISTCGGGNSSQGACPRGVPSRTCGLAHPPHSLASAAATALASPTALASARTMAACFTTCSRQPCHGGSSSSSRRAGRIHVARASTQGQSAPAASPSRNVGQSAADASYSAGAATSASSGSKATASKATASKAGNGGGGGGGGSGSSKDEGDWRQVVLAAAADPEGFVELNVRPKASVASSLSWRSISVRPVALRGERHLQVTTFTARQSSSANHPVPPGDAAAVEAVLAPVLQLEGVGSVTVRSPRQDISVQLTKRGKGIVHRSVPQVRPGPVVLSHDRPKDHAIPADAPHPFLIKIGFQTEEGRLRAGMADKFAQVNEFLKLLGHTGVVQQLQQQVQQVQQQQDQERGPGGREAGGQQEDGSGGGSGGVSPRPLHIVDCGCGSSHLSFGTYHYVSHVLGLPALLSGVDVNPQLMARANANAQDLGLGPGVHFTAAPIADFKPQPPPDIVLALHACDTATDDALALAVKQSARLIMAVPCCHQHLHKQLAGRPPSARPPFEPLLRHGILKQRALDLVTDTLRAALLRCAGYRTDVVEFVSTEHTPRNLLIRAVRMEARPTGSSTSSSSSQSKGSDGDEGEQQGSPGGAVGGTGSGRSRERQGGRAANTAAGAVAAGGGAAGGGAPAGAWDRGALHAAEEYVRLRDYWGVVPHLQVLLEQELGPLLRQAEAAVRADVA